MATRNIPLAKVNMGINLGHIQEFGAGVPFSKIVSDLETLRINRFRVLRGHDWLKVNDSKMKDRFDTGWIGGDSSSWTDHVPYKGGKWNFGRNPVPLALFIHLCNRAGAAPWVNIPHTASYRLKTEIIADAIAMSDNKPIFELSNEPWNAQFGQYHWYADKWHEKDIDEYKRVLNAYCVDVLDLRSMMEDDGLLALGSRFANPWTTRYMMDECSCAGNVDMVAVAPYIGYRIESGRYKNVSQLHEAMQEHLAGEVHDHMKEQADICRAYNVEMVAYEAGTHLMAHGEHVAADTKLYGNYNRSTRCGSLSADMYSMWEKLGGGLYLPYSFVGAFSGSFFPHVEKMAFDGSYKQHPKLTLPLGRAAMNMI